jgi:hypothetical protein
MDPTNSQNYWNTGYLWEQVTALATPLLVRVTIMLTNKTIFAAFFIRFILI